MRHYPVVRRQSGLTRTGIAAILLLGFALSACGGPQPTAGPRSAAPSGPAGAAVAQVEGLVTFDSRYDVMETVRRLSAGLPASGGSVVATVDHAADARSVGARLRPTVVLLGSMPKAGSALVAAGPQAGVNMPQKFLVWQDEAGAVRLTYNSAHYLALIADADADAGRAIAEGSARLAAAATGSAQPSSTGPTPTSRRDYLATMRSNADPVTTLRRLQEAVAAQGMLPAAVIDQARGAATIGVTLRYSTVLLVGNPVVGTPLIQANQTMGVDLPVRFLIWQGQDGATMVGYPDIGRLAQRHGIPADGAPVTVVRDTAAAFASAAAGRPA